MRRAIPLLIVFLLVMLLSKKFGEVSVKDYRTNLSRLNKEARKRFENFISSLQRLGYKVLITDAFRTHDDQDSLHRKDSRNAKAGTGSHEFGKALDINLFKNGKAYNKLTSKQSWTQTGVPQLANKLGIKWGGDFKNYHDPVHFYID